MTAWGRRLDGLMSRWTMLEACKWPCSGCTGWMCRNSKFIKKLVDKETNLEDKQCVVWGRIKLQSRRRILRRKKMMTLSGLIRDDYECELPKKNLSWWYKKSEPGECRQPWNNGGLATKSRRCPCLQQATPAIWSQKSIVHPSPLSRFWTKNRGG